MVHLGHVSSLAVLATVRRRGVAEALLQHFHAHVRQHTLAINSTGLHVRCSNRAAVHLYTKSGYVPAVRIPAYYEDGEDAYYMSKTLLTDATADPELRLPRVLGVEPPPVTQENRNRDNEDDEEEEEEDYAPALQSGSI